MIITKKFINNKRSQLLLPLEDYSDISGKNHTVINNGTSIRKLSDYSIPNVPTGAKSACFFEGTSWLQIAYDKGFEITDTRPITYSLWFYPTDMTDYRYMLTMSNLGDNRMEHNLDPTNFYYNAYNKKDGITHNISGRSNGIKLNQWNYVEVLYSDGREIIASSSVSQNGDIIIDTSTLIVPLKTNLDLFIGRLDGYGSRFFIGYMSQIHIIKGEQRKQPRTYNTTKEMIYFTLPNNKR